ncbi:NTP transferase domain-containing protein [Frigidibacter albus]|uniref:Molybdopterin-guanine dinucleotide biosynthesis protein A-like protein n=2 Tax=Frigidibacter mobilis TaxID=1335048 RepID=A0A159Z4F2_9RHOB|nr:NTP transferase domain-containing protein [Frigidibacter mobilis]AMY69144.1 molybdopterin-guanine dinucleotide biosynthesis protein A-like protein [Frigidibacter mobilis]
MRGGDKLLEPVAGMPLLRRQALAAVAQGLRVLVTLAPDQLLRAQALAGLAVDIVPVPEAAEGLAASLRAGAAAAQGAALLVMLADMPEIGAEDLAAVIAAHRAAPGAVIRAAGVEGTPGHPVLVPARMLAGLAELQGDGGARDLLRGEGAVLVPLPGRRALTDLDTPEDWAAWRAKTGL